MAATPHSKCGAVIGVRVRLPPSPHSDNGTVAQRQEAIPLKGIQCGFDSRQSYVNITKVGIGVVVLAR